MPSEPQQLKIYGIYIIHKNGMEVENICPKQMDAYAFPHLSTFLPLLQNILKKDIGEKFMIALSTDLLYCFIGKDVNIIAHTESKNSEEFASVCEKICNDIENAFPALKNWDGNKIPQLKEYLNKAFFGQKFQTFSPINKTNISLEEEITREACENIDAIERAHQLFLMCGQVYEDKRFLNKCTYRMENKHTDCYHVPRVYSLLGIVFNRLGEYGMSYEYFERAIDSAFKNKQEAFEWGDDENLKAEKDARIRNSAIALSDAYYGLAEYNLARDDFLRAKDCLNSAKEEISFIDKTAKSLRETDFEILYVVALLKQREKIREQEDIDENKKIQKAEKIQSIEKDLENIFRNLESNIENKIKTIEDEILKRFYKEKLVRVYTNWGDFLLEKEEIFSKKWTEVGIKKYEKSLEIMDEIGIIRGRETNLFNLTISYAIVENFNMSEYYLEYMKKEAEYNKAIRTELKIGEIFFNLLYSMRGGNTAKILEMVLEINSILEREKKLPSSLAAKLRVVSKKAIEFLKNK